MTCGEIYEKNKEIYNEEAIDFISERLKAKGDMCHRPFELMTYKTRTICKKINDDEYFVFDSYVKDIEYSEYREIKKYHGEKKDTKVYIKQDIIRMFGFEISLNPRSKSNRLIKERERK